MKNSKEFLNCILSHSESKEVTIFFVAVVVHFYFAFLAPGLLSFFHMKTQSIYSFKSTHLIHHCVHFLLKLSSLLNSSNRIRKLGWEPRRDWPHQLCLSSCFVSIILFTSWHTIPGHLKQKKTFLSKEIKGQRFPTPGKWQRRAGDQKIAQALVCYCHIIVFQPHLHP